MKAKIRNYGAMLVAALIIFSLSTNAYACACCYDPGEWNQRSHGVDEFHRNQINEVNFAPLANRFMTEAGDDAVKGMSSSSDKYSFSITRQGRRWTLNFKDEAGKTGTLSFMIPPTMISYSVDPYGGDNYDGGASPSLYHEWRFAGAVTGTGIFKKGMTGRTRFHLVLQGTSNACIDAAGFHNWNLQINGPRAKYAFYGSLKATSNAPENAKSSSTQSEAAASNDDQAVRTVMLALVEAWNETATRELIA